MLLGRLFSQIVESGDLTVIDATGRVHRFGDGRPPRATMRLHDKALHVRLALNPRLALGEAYMDGTLTVDEGSLHDLLSILSANIQRYEALPMTRLGEAVGMAFRGLQQRNPIGRAQANVAHHYDLSDDLYELFLDGDRQYSCAYFNSPYDTLETAQCNKKRHIAAKLLLDRSDLRVLDIGSGWGGLGLYLSQQADAKVTGVTLSTEQHKYSQDQVARLAIAGRTEFRLRDYRLETGPYDRIVSVGMFEHVGAARYKEYFGKISEMLTDDGVALVHTIGRSSPPGQTNSWIRKYIFPGGYTPALSEIVAAVEKTDLIITDVEILRLHYAQTLRHWLDRFQSGRYELRKIYDERFCRMWEFYLVSAEISFRHLGQVVFQIQLAKRQDAVPLTRDYIAQWEAEVTAVGQAAD
ncbi:MAG: cyclopropane-fatty-acyl-phospholipid synthase [Alphaproteobacteria bacterium]|nr:cyclopropane-fatty-acyl-phospholipid synthase [Alphaproteobacteria bacterium]